MNLTLDIPDIHLFEIVESSVRRFFRETEIGDSDAVRHINRRINSQLRDEIERQLAGLITSLVGPAIVGTAAGGAQHSPFTGMVRDVVNFQDLQNVTKYPDSGKYVYALATTGGSVQPAFIMSPKRWPYMTIYGTDPNEEIRKNEQAIGWRWDGYWGVGFGLPQCAVRMKIV